MDDIVKKLEKEKGSFTEGNRLAISYLKSSMIDCFPKSTKEFFMRWISRYSFLFVAVLFSCEPMAGSPAWLSEQISSTRKVAQKNNKNMLSLKIGQTRGEVLNIMGDPAKTESYDLGNGNVVVFYFYRTEGWSNQTLYDTDRQFTPVAFQNDKVIGWGRNYYDRVIKHQLDLKVGDAGFGLIPDFDPSEVVESF